jgi:hypothetical protein
MQYALIRHKVTDYDLWKPIFDEHGAARKANGISGHQLFRNINDQSEVIILVEVDDLGVCPIRGSARGDAEQWCRGPA